MGSRLRGRTLLILPLPARRLFHFFSRRFAVLPRLVGLLRAGICLLAGEPVFELLHLVAESVGAAGELTGLIPLGVVRFVPRRVRAVGKLPLAIGDVLCLVFERLHRALECGALEHLRALLELFAQSLLHRGEVFHGLTKSFVAYRFERAASELGIKVCSLWGMTEVLAATLTEPSRASDKSPTTDGRPLEGMEVRIVDFDGKPVPTGQSGRLLVRGCQMFTGYYKKSELKTFDAEGWFDSGDLAYMDGEGYIRISGRVKDVLIRGGENVPVVEIENLLYKHPAVAAVAVVGYPDARLGERGCAFIVPKPGSTIDLPAMQAYLAECKMAKQFWPERVELVADLPRTASGKIQKFKLKEVAQAFGDGK